MNIDLLKKTAAEEAVEEIKDGMVVGLGSGSTVKFALEKIAEKISKGLLKDIKGVPTSISTEKISLDLGIPIISLDEAFQSAKKYSDSLKSIVKIIKPINLTIDGADEVDKHLNLIKGGGGAMLREKIVAQATERLIIIVDESKLSKCLGEKWSVPIEVIKFALESEITFLESIGAEITVRKNSSGENYITDEENFVIDANLGEINNVEELTRLLDKRAGIVEHGLFLGMTDMVICAETGGIRKIKHV